MDEIARLKEQVIHLRRKRLPLEEKLLKPSPMIAGSVSRISLRCGKKGCVCQTKGHEGHGPYWMINLLLGGGKIKRVCLKQKQDIHAALAYRRYQRTLASYRQVTKEIDGLFNQFRECKLYTPGT